LEVAADWHELVGRQVPETFTCSVPRSPLSIDDDDDDDDDPGGLLQHSTAYRTNTAIITG